MDFKKITLLLAMLFLPTPFFTAAAPKMMVTPAHNGAMPPHGAFPPGMPEISEEEFKALAKEVETFFKNMSDEELADFVKFAEDVESGKIDINELLPPGMQQPQGMQRPQPVQPKPEDLKKPTPTPTEQAVEKPAGPALRNKAAAQRMLKNLLERLDSMRSKAAGYELVADSLKPWNSKLDTLTYYIHVISDKDHVDQLITDKELLTLHDTLKELSDALTLKEPLLQIPEFGLEKLEPAAKERSKKALKNIITSFETAFTRKSVIAGLESLMKKYEPELLKKRKEAEAAQERAAKQVEGLPKQPTPSRIRTDRTTPSKGFYDQYYHRPSAAPSRYEPRYTEPKHSDVRPSTPHREAKSSEEKKPVVKDDRKKLSPDEEKKKAGGTSAAGDEVRKKKEESAAKKKEEEEKRKREAEKPYTPTTEHEKVALKHIEKIIKSMEFIENKFDEDVLFEGGHYFETEIPVGQRDGLKTARGMNNALADLSRALHRIARDKSAAQSSTRKSPKDAQSILSAKLEVALASHEALLKELYDQGFTFLKKSSTQEGKQLANKIALHLGYVGEGVDPRHKEESSDNLVRYFEAYEQVYKPREQKARESLTEKLYAQREKQTAEVSSTPRQEVTTPEDVNLENQQASLPIEPEVAAADVGEL